MKFLKENKAKIIVLVLALIGAAIYLRPRRLEEAVEFDEEEEA